MRIRKLLVSITIFIAVSIGAYSIASAQVVTKIIDCAEWLKAREEHQAISYQGYVDGVVDGMSMGIMVSIRGENIPPKYSSEQIFYWMDRYCRNSPLNSLLSGIVQFANEVTNDAYKKAQSGERSR